VPDYLGGRVVFKEIKTAEQAAEEEYLLQYNSLKLIRNAAYQEETDPLFFKYQRGEIEKQVWLDAVEDIKNRFPYPPKP
jgi:hypothetical protein